MERIGSYINPVTGEEDWIEPKTIENILLIPKRVKRIGDPAETPIEFKLSYREEEEKVGLYAEYYLNNRSYRSDVIDFDLEEFANEIAAIVYSNKTLDESTMVKEAKERTFARLTERLFSENIVLSDFLVKGLGFVYTDNKKAIVFDTLRAQAESNNSSDAIISIENCIGSISLQNLNNPKIIFNTGNHEITFNFKEVQNANEGRIRNYDIKVSNLSVKPSMQFINLKDIKDEDDLIQDRMTLLDSLSSEDDDLDDRFNDII